VRVSAWRNAFVGAVVSPIDSDRSTLHGACFAFLDGDHFVTADHLIEKAIAEGHHQIQVMGPGLYPVTADVFRHSSADVAVLRAGGLRRGSIRGGR
jgi:hypothetical protein